MSFENDVQSQNDAVFTRNHRRMKYAENVNVYEDNVGKVRLVPKDFAIFVYSCPDEAQNCYFAMKNNAKIQLLKDKYEFHFDKPFKQRLLRFIDNEFMVKRAEEDEDHVDFAKKI